MRPASRRRNSVNPIVTLASCLRHETPNYHVALEHVGEHRHRANYRPQATSTGIGRSRPCFEAAPVGQGLRHGNHQCPTGGGVPGLGPVGHSSRLGWRSDVADPVSEAASYHIEIEARAFRRLHHEGDPHGTRTRTPRGRRGSGLLVAAESWWGVRGGAQRAPRMAAPADASQTLGRPQSSPKLTPSEYDGGTDESDDDPWQRRDLHGQINGVTIAAQCDLVVVSNHEPLSPPLSANVADIIRRPPAL
jgi:hypothetical protein